MGVDVEREAAAGAETPRSGGDTTVRQGDHGSAETPRFGGDATVRRQGRPERRTAQNRQKSSKPTETIEAQLRI